jgi:hypothetical protein
VAFISVSLLLEKARRKREAYRSGRRERLGIPTRREAVGFEKPGEKKLIPKRKRPKKSDSLLDKTVFRAKTKKSRMW